MAFQSKSGHILSVAAAATLLCSTVAAEQPPTSEEMWRIIQEQQKQIAALKAQLTHTEQKVEATGEAIDTLQQHGGSEADAGSASALGAGHGPFDHGKAGRTIVGGYGELHYNNLDNQKAGGSDKDEIDFHRAILFLGHQFNDDIRFFSEIEYEHANTEANGVVELEQAYMEFDLNDRHRARAGQILTPVGILNETHEPPTFYGVERNPVENKIIPTTWSVGGGSLLGEIGNGFSYDVVAHEGLNTGAADNYAIRAGRQFTSEATASDPAFTGRLKWTGMPGIELAASFQHQTDITQGSDPTAGSANLIEMHGIAAHGPFTLRALYARWDLDGSGPAAVGADEQAGWYIEPSYKLTEQVGLFARYNEWDNRAGDAADSEYTQADIGVNYWPHPDVVLKADYQDQSAPSGQNEYDGFNLGVGYQF